MGEISIQRGDLDRIRKELGRDPTRAEQALFENLWSEHCAYRSSRRLLSLLPGEGEHVYVGPGDDAGVLKLPNGTLLAVGMESHNHPSYVDPHNGAATGVGGIVRDILSMGARPIALGDPLRFGSLDYEKNRYLLEHVVEGISSYGNSIGVPVVTGDLEINGSYQGNPLVNVSCIGIVEEDELVGGEARDPGNSLVLLGSSTGRDGLGGASFASRELEEEAEEESRPNVQIGDPFTEKLLIECCRELVRGDLVLSMRDLGAAGLGGASSEMCHSGGVGADIDLDEVHLREEGMEPWEIIVSESQERMLLEVDPREVGEVGEVADKYDLPARTIGRTTVDERYVLHRGGRNVCDLPLELLVEGAPLEDRERAAAGYEPERNLPQVDIQTAVEEVLASPNVSLKGWVYRQYDHDVQVRTVVGPGDDAAVLRLDDGAIAYTAGGFGHLVERDPFKGTALVVSERFRRIACMGAEPLGMVDCLNFGSPERPPVFGQFSDAVEGMAEAAEALGLPVLGGNVSFYNESEETGTAVNPSPTVGVVGWLDEAGDAVGSGIESDDLALVLAGGGDALGGSEFLRIFGGSDRVREPDYGADLGIARVLAEDGTSAARCVSRGGPVAAAAKMSVTNGIGAELDLAMEETFSESGALIATDEPGPVVERLPGAKVVGETGGDELSGNGFSLTLEQVESLLLSLEGVMGFAE